MATLNCSGKSSVQGETSLYVHARLTLTEISELQWATWTVALYQTTWTQVQMRAWYRHANNQIEEPLWKICSRKYETLFLQPIRIIKIQIISRRVREPPGSWLPWTLRLWVSGLRWPRLTVEMLSRVSRGCAARSSRSFPKSTQQWIKSGDR